MNKTTLVFRYFCIALCIALLAAGCSATPAADAASPTPTADGAGAVRGGGASGNATGGDPQAATDTPAQTSEPAPTEESAMAITNVPPDGEWAINHISGQMVCPSFTRELSPFATTQATLFTEEGGEVLHVLFVGEEVVLTRTASTATSSTYAGTHINQEGFESDYALLYDYRDGEHYIENTLEGELEGCTLTRTYSLSPLAIDQ